MFFDSLETLLKQLKEDRQGKSLVFTNGCFDILHRGHVHYLQEAKTCGDLLVVGLNSDHSVKRLKGQKRPVQPQGDRAEILAALACVDYTFIFDQDTPQMVIEKINPDILVKGGDWSVDQIVGADFVIAKGAQVKSLPFVEGCSTTEVIERIKALSGGLP